LLTDQLAGVIRVRAYGEGRALFFSVRLDDNEFGPVN
jgi:hypothetical protein